MKTSTHTLDLSWELIGFDEVPDADYSPTVAVLTTVPEAAECWERTILGFDEIPPHGYSEGARYLDPQERVSAAENVVFAVLDETSEAGVESTQVLIARLEALNIPEHEAFRFVSVWRQGHADPWIRAHDDAAEMWCK
jgi:hypothetical protein